MVKKMENKRNARLVGMVVGMILGFGVGLAIDNIAVGAGMGVAYGVAFGRAFSGEEIIQDKKKRRTVSWGLLGTCILGCLAFGYLAGDIMLGLTAGIGFSFVIGLKWEKLYDERMSSMFSKAARNAFVTVNAGLSASLLFSQMGGPLEGIPVGNLLMYVVYLSWVVFLVSWLYHANYKGE